MILKGQVFKDQIQIESEIEKVAGKRKEKQREIKEESSTTSSLLIEIFQESTMVEEKAPQPRRTLRDYAMHWRPRHFSNIAIPATTKSLDMKPVFLSLISTHQFTAIDHEDPYTHLCKFYELVETIGFQSSDIETVYLRGFFPFSLA